MMINYPYKKPLDSKGFVTRQYIAQDVVNFFVPSLILSPNETGASAQSSSLAAREPAPNDAGIKGLTAPSINTVVNESASADKKGV
jgi:hypothetical protein